MYSSRVFMERKPKRPCSRVALCTRITAEPWLQQPAVVSAGPRLQTPKSVSSQPAVQGAAMDVAISLEHICTKGFGIWQHKNNASNICPGLKGSFLDGSHLYFMGTFPSAESVFFTLYTTYGLGSVSLPRNTENSL